jgi:hypothetical protein
LLARNGAAGKELGREGTAAAARARSAATHKASSHLARLAAALQAAGHEAEAVATFLMRCAFTLLGEGVGVVPARGFAKALEQSWIPAPASFPRDVAAIWRTLSEEGRLFAKARPLPLSRPQLELLLDAARCDWARVEPAILGTLLERATAPSERHALGAHYTPRAYVDRLVGPTVEAPLREDWAAVRAEARRLVAAGQVEAAVDAVRAFQEALAATRVLDPACGAGNFLYVALQALQRIEGEVRTTIARLRGASSPPGTDAPRVSPAQLLGIDVERRAIDTAALAVRIGYLQGLAALRGQARPSSTPATDDTAHLECRDAVLAWDSVETGRGPGGEPVVLRYVKPRKAAWPRADFIVGNPPFMGKLKLRRTLGEAYVAALREAYEGDVPESADYVMCWWSAAAHRVATHQARRFGLVTTNSITQTFNRRVVARALSHDPRVDLVLALADHPWVEGGAQVRIAMTVGAPAAATATRVNADLTRNVDASAAAKLAANRSLAHVGVALHGAGFAIDAATARRLLSEATAAGVRDAGRFIRPILNGRDLVRRPRGAFVIDLFGLSEPEAARLGPIYRWVRAHVKPARDGNRREARRRDWWLLGENAPRLRAAVRGLHRYIGTTLSARHRVFQLIDASVLPDQTIVVIASSDPWVLGVLSSRAHAVWAEATGGRLGAGNDLRYLKAACFDAFPFPVATAAGRARVARLASRLERHRRARQAAHPDLTITRMYNVLGKLRAAEGLTAKESLVLEHGRVAVLREIHDDLDAAVIDAYGWPSALSDEQMLERLVALNAERAG